MKLSKMTHFFVYDVESIGLYGEGFAVGYTLIDREGTTIREDWFHCDSARAESAGGELDPQDRAWVAENVPALSPTSRLTSPKSVRDVFWAQWMRAKKDFPNVMMASECVWPVDTAFMTACIMDDVDARKWEGPHPMLDIATVLAMAGRDPLGVFDRSEEELVHHPLGDARQSARLLIECLELIGLHQSEGLTS